MGGGGTCACYRRRLLHMVCAPLSLRARGQRPSRQCVGRRRTSPLLLTRDAVPELQAALGLPEDSTFAADVYRALEQARLRIEGVRK